MYAQNISDTHGSYPPIVQTKKFTGYALLSVKENSDASTLKSLKSFLCNGYLLHRREGAMNRRGSIAVANYGRMGGGSVPNRPVRTTGPWRPIVPSVPRRVGKDGRAWRPFLINTAVL